MLKQVALALVLLFLFLMLLRAPPRSGTSAAVSGTAAPTEAVAVQPNP